MIASVNLTDLAPMDLPILRDLRYDGDGFGLPLSRFAEEDQQLFRRLYAAVHSFYDFWLATREAPDFAALRRRVEALDREGLLPLAQHLGVASRAQGLLDPLVSKALHDARGGGLVLFLSAAELLGMVADPAPILNACVFAARDHAKIMRNALVDIDQQRRVSDQVERAHPFQDFVSKWQGAPLHAGGQGVRVAVRSTFHGAVTAGCLETSAVDRILYNYLNNAARFAADEVVALNIFPTTVGVIRWVVSNTLAPDQRSWLEEHTDMDLRKLFQGGTTHGGSGIGLSACADFVASSFGLPSARQAVTRGYLGARAVDGYFHSWFHWPAYQPHDAVEACPC